ncbi:hypothetical protein HanRHA438_Chr10g0443681 [Helianthus annuus]|nr:hypothetical protein HanRHA438_Chr10g0443681 [Helianthus annuus]
MLRMLRAFSIASSDGLQTIGVFGNSEVESVLEKCPIMSNISSSQTLLTLFTRGFSVSKQIIPSKQSSNPSLLKTLAAWILSAFVNI